MKADGSTKADDRNCSRGVLRALKKETLLPPPLLVGIPLWHQGKNQQVVEPVAFQPIHEVLDALVVPGQEGDWLSCNSAQEDFQRRVKDWGKRVSVDDTRNVAGLQLWGDSAPTTHKDSVFLLTWTCLTGVHRRRFRLCAVTKRRLCKCGCYGRCTFGAMFRVIAWMFEVLLTSIFPKAGPCRVPFQEPWRANAAGQPLLARGACISKCGDWA